MIEQNDKNHIWCIIMAGGIGSRFWPVSKTDNPKQFIDVMGVGKSMLQLTFERCERVCKRENIVIVTGEQYTDQVHDQLPGLLTYQVLGEPFRRNTAPCIAYAASVIEKIDPQAIVIVSPSDHAIFREDCFYADMQQAIATAAENPWIITLGAQPSRPDTSYGYIQFCDSPSLPGRASLHKAVTFTEKPPVELAMQFIASGEFYWNVGIFVWRMDVLKKAYRQYLPSLLDGFEGLSDEASPAELEAVYAASESISVDNAIMEKADNVHVLTASFAWSDVETWDTLYDVTAPDAEGNAVIGHRVFTYDSRRCMITASSGRTVVVEGLDGYIVADTPDTLMVCRRSSEDQIFRFISDVELMKTLHKE